jgi:hypothetical protein
MARPAIEAERRDAPSLNHSGVLRRSGLGINFVNKAVGYGAGIGFLRKHFTDVGPALTIMELPLPGIDECRTWRRPA